MTLHARHILLSASHTLNPVQVSSWPAPHQAPDDGHAAPGGAAAAPARPLSLIERVLPQRMVPYAQLMRLHAPIGEYTLAARRVMVLHAAGTDACMLLAGTWLLAWPCFWSIALAAPAGALPDAQLLALFGAGAVLLRGAGCTVNDLWDRDLDAKVERTKSRPLASGAITPAQALGDCFHIPCSPLTIPFAASATYSTSCPAHPVHRAPALAPEQAEGCT